MIVLGVDPGSNITGYAFVEAEMRRMRVLEYGVIRSKPRETLYQKLKRISEALERLIEENTPRQLALETAFFDKYPRAALILGHVRGAIMVTAQIRQLELFEYEPRLIKKTTAGIGHASKHQIGEMVRRHFGLKSPPKPADAADALACCYCHLLRTKQI